jgi:glycerophosphoryl diester phosphodiesterase
MRVLEQHIVGKLGDPEKCEDVIYVSDHFACIADGSTIGPPVNGRPSGRIAAEAVVAGLAKVPAEADMHSALQTINAHVRDVFGYPNSDHVHALGRRPAAPTLIFSLARQELWAAGDLQVMVDGRKIDLRKKVDQIATDFRCMVVRALLAQGRTVTDLMNTGEDSQFLKAFFEMQQPAFLNRTNVGDLGYCDVDGGDQNIPLVKVIPIGGVKRLVMASDGYVDIHHTLAECEA